MRDRLLLLFFQLIFFIDVQAQSPNIGLVLNTEKAEQGYVLFTPEDNEMVYLINNCGGVVNQWEFRDQPNRTCYLLENGDLLRAGKNYLETRSWGNSLKWAYDLEKNDDLQIHHDIEPLPNGNILCILYDYYSRDEMIAIGRDGSKTDDEFRLDKIVEIKPQGVNDFDVVWEWKLKDHLIQDFDPSKQNYGQVANHPELIDINYDNGETLNFSHMNGIDYNEELDQILFSFRNLSEIYIIDHSTTTLEAAGHSGGKSGKGGDILWRWGNPLVYKQGLSSDQKLFSQHDPKWISSGYQDEGKITVFNNDPVTNSTTDGSAITMLSMASTGSYEISNGTFLPDTAYWQWSGSVLGRTMFENRKSGVNALPNGGLLVCESKLGRVTQVSRSGEVIWSYVNPHGTSIFDQYEPELGLHGLFRGEFYPASYPGLASRELVSQGFIENENPLSESCGEAAMEREILKTPWSQSDLSITNPVSGGRLNVTGNIHTIEAFILVSLDGKTIKLNKTQWEGGEPLSVSSGLYIASVFLPDGVKTMRLAIED